MSRAPSSHAELPTTSNSRKTSLSVREEDGMAGHKTETALKVFSSLKARSWDTCEDLAIWRFWRAIKMKEVLQAGSRVQV